MGYVFDFTETETQCPNCGSYNVSRLAKVDENTGEVIDTNTYVCHECGYVWVMEG